MDFIYDNLDYKVKKLAVIAHELESCFSILCTAVLQLFIDKSVQLKLSDAK